MGTANSQVESEAMDNVLTKEDKDKVSNTFPCANSPSLLTTRSQPPQTKWFSSLQTMHLTAAIFMGVQAIAYGAAIGDTTASTTPTVSFQGSSNDDCEGLSCSINIKSVGEFDTLWMMPVFVAMASLDHIICYTYSKLYPESAMSWIFDVKSNPARWIEYSLSASLMALALTALCRITDVHLWFLIFFMTAIGMGCGQVLELLPYPGSPEDKNWPLPTSCATLRTLVFTLGSFSIFLPWLVMMW